MPGGLNGGELIDDCRLLNRPTEDSSMPLSGVESEASIMILEVNAWLTMIFTVTNTSTINNRNSTIINRNCSGGSGFCNLSCYSYSLIT